MIYHNGAWRAFLVGTSPSVMITSWYAIVMFMDNGRYLPRGMGAIETKLFLLFALAIIASSGLVAVAVRWWALKIAQLPQAAHSPSDGGPV